MIFAVAIELTVEIIGLILGILVAGASLAGSWHLVQYRIPRQEEQMKEDRAKTQAEFDALKRQNQSEIDALKRQVEVLQSGERSQSERTVILETKLDAVIKSLARIEQILANGSVLPHGNE